MRFKSLAGVLLLAEVADEVAPFCVCNGHDVEEEGLHVEVEGLVAKEELGKEANALAVLLVTFTTNLEHRDRLLTVDLVPRRVAPHTFSRVTSQLKI